MRYAEQHPRTFEWAYVSRGVHEIGSERAMATTRVRTRVHVWHEEILVHEIPDMEAVSPDRRENKLAELFITGPAPQLTQPSHHVLLIFFFLFLSLFISFSLGASLIAQLSGSPSRRRRTTCRRTNFERSSRDSRTGGCFCHNAGSFNNEGVHPMCDLLRLIPVSYVRLRLFL